MSAAFLTLPVVNSERKNALALFYKQHSITTVIFPNYASKGNVIPLQARCGLESG